MTSRGTESSNYWQLLDEAFVALDAGDYPGAERLFTAASDNREQSPGRVFFTEKLGDGLRRLVRGSGDKEPDPGRWERRAERFRIGFTAEGEKVVREGVRLAELRPEDDAEANQPVLAAALYLVARSRLFPEEPASAIPLLKGLFRTARRTGRTFPVDLVRHDLPLTEEDRLWLARRGTEILEAFVEQGRLAPGSDESVAWAEAFLQLLDTRYFGLTGRLEEERSWLEAVTSDRLLKRPGASVELYRAYLEARPEPGPRTDEARVRILELLGNTDGIHFDVPDYQRAFGAFQAAGLEAGSALAERYARARDRIEFRRPDPEDPQSGAPAWASLAVEADGRVAAVFWWDAEPRDVAFWEPDRDCRGFESFLAMCGDRLVAADENVLAFTAGTLGRGPAPWCLGDFLTALFETRIGRGGLDPATIVDLARAETGPWRAGWDPERGHPWLEPPRGAAGPAEEPGGPAPAAVRTGLAWLAIRSRVSSADPALRAGIGELARRGDPASRFLYDSLTLDRAASLALDAAFEPWTLPLLWTRPDPFAASVRGTVASARGDLDDPALRPDLGRHDLAVVGTGDPASVLAAWGTGREKWRVVLDRLDRLEALSQVAGGAIGPVTLIPASGSVHELTAALGLLDSLPHRREEGHAGLLALFHWVRLVETHNGDLLDFRQIRPRLPGVVPLYDAYADLVADLPCERPRLEGQDHLDAWGGQFSQRVRKAGLVAGTVAHLGADTSRLDSLWGVFEGSDASWVFLDSAAVHWALLEEGEVGIRDLHALLHTRGRRHLSLLTGAVCLRDDLDELLTAWLGVFGSPYFLTMTDQRGPVLKLADRGVQPEAEILAAEACAGQATWLDRRFADGSRGTILVPREGQPAAFWSAVRGGDLSLAGAAWRFLAPGEPPLEGGGFLAVPALSSLTGVPVPVAGRDVRVSWAEADRERAAFLAMRRGLCSLELAAHLAGPWDEVCVLDTRWWRLVARDTAEGAEGARLPSGRTAAAAQGSEGITTFDLPGNLGGDLPLDARMFDQVAGWFRARGERVPPWRGDEESAGASAVEETRGVVLLREGTADPWPAVADRVAEAWERGRLDRWLLVVADVVPAGAAELTARGWAAGTSAWSSGEAPGDPAPVLWALPEDFEDPGLRRHLDRHPPEVVLAGGLADWLPGPDRPSQETALALRGILDSGATLVLLDGRGLADPWCDFLAASGRATIRGSAAESEDDPSGSAVPEIPLAFGVGEAAGAAGRTERLRALLAGLRSVLSSGWGRITEGGQEPAPPPIRQLLPLGWLGRLAGIEPGEVAEGVRVLRWTARLAGDRLSAAEGEGDRPNRAGEGHALLIPERFADLETHLANLEEDLTLLLPLWLGHGRAGTLSWVDLERPPVRIDPRRLALVDEFLGAVEGPETGLVFRCPPGRLHASRRLIGCLGEAPTVMAALREALRVFQSRLGEVMASAVETPDGFLVETGLVDLRGDELDFLATGSALGFWRWLGPACPGALHVVDLLTLADSPTVKGGEHAWRLWESELARRLPAVHTLPVPTEGGPSGTGRRGLRSLLAMGAQTSDDLDPAVDRVAALAGEGDPGSILVLRGVVGTGRHEALARGIDRALADRAEPPRLTVHCPDDAVGGQVAREFLAQGITAPYDLVVGTGDGSLGGGQPLRHPPVDHRNEVVVLCELQRFESETRYRIAQTGRGRRLLVTADPAAAGESWENLFLTTPRADDVVELDVQRHQARRLWNGVRSLLPAPFQGKGAARRRDRGTLVADYAANLDQGLARLAMEHGDGRLPDRIRLTAPMPADLQYLGASLRDRGWVAVGEDELDALLLPGPREFLAVATDCLTRAGDLASWFDPGAVWQENPDEPTGPVAEPVTPDLLAERLLEPAAARSYLAWLEEAAPARDATLLDLAEAVADTPWANGFLAHPEARRRCVGLLEKWGRESLADLLDQPQWEAWWYVTIEDLAVTPPLGRRPLVALAEAERRPGSRWPGGCYLCLGPEAPARHYEHLARVTDDLLVLYQEHSPLPGDRSP